MRCVKKRARAWRLGEGRSAAWKYYQKDFLEDERSKKDIAHYTNFNYLNNTPKIQRQSQKIRPFGNLPPTGYDTPSTTRSTSTQPPTKIDRLQSRRAAL